MSDPCCPRCGKVLEGYTSPRPEDQPTSLGKKIISAFAFVVMIQLLSFIFGFANGYIFIPRKMECHWPNTNLSLFFPASYAGCKLGEWVLKPF